MNELEIEVGSDLLMSHPDLNAVSSSIDKGEVYFWYRGIDHVFFDLANLVRWFNINS